MKITLLLSCMLTSLAPSSGFVQSLQRINLKNQLREACANKDTATIFTITDKLSKINPTNDIIQDFNKLNGRWKLDFTTAPRSEVPDDDNINKNGPGVKTFQSIDNGMIYNVIDQGLPEKGLKIGVGAEATRPNRVALDFRTIEAFNDRFPRKVTLRFPPRAFFRLINQIGASLKGRKFDELEFKELAYFDVLFLDDDLRIQRNSEGNLFINSRIRA